MTEPWSTSTRTPRRWQYEALPRCLEAAKAGSRGVVSAVMGSGKSVLIAELVRLLLEGLGDGWHIVVTTPTIRLVDQLHETISEAVGDVGRWYTHAHDLHRVTVACTPSAPDLARAIRETSGRCAVWIADEAHRTESETIGSAAEALDPYSSIGFTATPYLSDPRKRLRHFDQLLFEYSAQAAMADGVVCQPVLVHYEGKASYADEAVLEMIRDEGGPGLVNAATIADAVEYSGRLCREGIEARAIHSRMAKPEQELVIERLRIGELRCLVHVRLLSEGVDLPWLRWLALRQPVSSRVAFCQQVGRVLRAFPGKIHARILDPHDLFNEHGLSYEAMLGCQAEEPPSVDDAMRELAAEVSESDTVDLPIFFDAVSSYLRRLALALYSAGYARREIKSRGWRKDPPSPKQIQTADRMQWVLSYAPEPHNGALCRAMDVIDSVESEFFCQLNKGDVSDLLETLFVLARLRRWPALDTMGES